jgi:hypothetical protein
MERRKAKTPLLMEMGKHAVRKMIREESMAIDEQILVSELISLPVDRGFDPFVRKPRPGEGTIAAIYVEEGYCGEYGRPSYFQQGKRRTILAGQIWRQHRAAAEWHTVAEALAVILVQEHCRNT